MGDIQHGYRANQENNIPTQQNFLEADPSQRNVDIHHMGLGAVALPHHHQGNNELQQQGGNNRGVQGLHMQHQRYVMHSQISPNLPQHSNGITVHH